MTELLEQTSHKKIILQGNVAFAVGVIHAGFHAADGYPGTPSTEILDHLKQVPEKIIAEWSVNEAVAVGVGVGHSIAGHDTVVTMKVPGLFQAADVVASAAFSESYSGALVFFIATDHAPSSTQYIVDSRHFLSSLHLPIIEPRDHQDLYHSASHAADLSRRFSTPVAIVCSSVLCHSEGIIVPQVRRSITRTPSKKIRSKVLLPSDARNNFNRSVNYRIPGIRNFIRHTHLFQTFEGDTEWGIIACGEASLIVKESISQNNINPHQLYLGISNPLPVEFIEQWACKISGPVFLIEDGERFIEMQLRQTGIKIIGKRGMEATTHWTPDLVTNLLTKSNLIESTVPQKTFDEQIHRRVPAICPGCPYRSISLAIQSLKKQNKLDLVFGDIGCSTLIHFQNALDINLCMGASESMRQGYVRSRPLSVNRVISLIGDSSECHSGLDASRNAVFRNTPGVKIILDNGVSAMTGGQKTPTSRDNSGYVKFQLTQSLEAEGMECIKVDAFNEKLILHSLEKALYRALSGRFVAVVIEGRCVKFGRGSSNRDTELILDEDLCKKCNLCSICPAIDPSSNPIKIIKSLCTRCGDGRELCVQRCSSGALQIREKSSSFDHRFSKDDKKLYKEPDIAEDNQLDTSSHYPDMETELPDSFRLLICGVGGQGIMFIGKVLTQIMQITPYLNKNIIKGEIHGMAQKGGCVSSTLACGNVHSPVFSSQSVDIMIAMEQNEALRPQYLNLLKPNAMIILNQFSITPTGTAPDKLPAREQIFTKLDSFEILPCNANRLAPLNSNVAIIGLLSTTSPFVSIPSSQWIQVLKKLSKNSTQVRQNINAFELGRNEQVMVHVHSK